VGILTWVIWGLFVGALARLLLPGRQRLGIALTIVLGVVGSLLGGFLATEVLKIGDANDADFGSFVIAVATSVLLLAIFERVNRMLADRKRAATRSKCASTRRTRGRSSRKPAASKGCGYPKASASTRASRKVTRSDWPTTPCWQSSSPTERRATRRWTVCATRSP